MKRLTRPLGGRSARLGADLDDARYGVALAYLIVLGGGFAAALLLKVAEVVA